MLVLGSDRIMHELTCPECCYSSLQKVKANLWKCEVCGTVFDFSKLRKVFGKCLGREFTQDFIEELLVCTRVERAPKLGERGWRWVGKHGTLYTLDAGNGWHVIVSSITHERNTKT
jgi:rubredoxin